MSSKLANLATPCRQGKLTWVFGEPRLQGGRQWVSDRRDHLHRAHNHAPSYRRPWGLCALRPHARHGEGAARSIHTKRGRGARRTFRIWWCLMALVASMRYAATNVSGAQLRQSGPHVSHHDPAELLAKRVCRFLLEAIAAGDGGYVCISDTRCIDSATRVSRMRCLALASALANSELVQVGARVRPATQQTNRRASALLHHARRGRGPWPRKALPRAHDFDQ